jgi:hypothetical protein
MPAEEVVQARGRWDSTTASALECQYLHIAEILRTLLFGQNPFFCRPSVPDLALEDDRPTCECSKTP